MQHHARQRTPLALPSMSPLARRLRHDASPLEMKLGPGVAPAEAVVLHQMLVEVLDREALAALAIEPLHLLGPVDGNPPRPATERPLAPLLLPGSAPPIPNGVEDSKTPPCAPPEGPPSSASQPLQKGP